MKKMTMISALVCVAAFATEGLAQAAASADPSVYSAELIARNVHVRSGPSATKYYCVELSKPAKVTVVGKSGDWLKILPPQGCYSVVSKDSVRLAAGGKTGRIIGDAVWARAGGFPANPGRFSMLQKRLKADERVMVLGQTGSYYKIVPPSGAYFWIEAKSVKRVGAATIDIGPTVTRPTTRPGAATTRAVKIEYKPHPDVLALKALDKELMIECNKPFKERDYEALLAKYRSLKPSKDSGAEPHIAARIKGLETEIERQKDAETATEIITQAATGHRDFQIARTKLGMGSTTRRVVPHTAKGIVAPSAIYSKNTTIGRRFLLRDAKAVRINAYLISTSGEIAMADYVGKLVEVYGRSGFDKDLGADLIDVQKVVLVSPDAVLPGPPAPTVTPPDKPKKAAEDKAAEDKDKAAKDKD